VLRPPWSRLATPVTCPSDAARWWVALISMPTVTRSRPACRAEPSEPSVSARTHDAPPWRSPYGWVLPATGMVPTTRWAVASRMVIPIRSTRVSLLPARYASVICRAMSCSTATSRLKAGVRRRTGSLGWLIAGPPGMSQRPPARPALAGQLPESGLLPRRFRYDPAVLRYLAGTGLRLDYETDGVAVYRP